MIDHAIDKQSLIELTKTLVRIPSISTSTDDKGEYNENTIALFIHNYFKKRAIPTGFIPTADGRNGVYAYIPGKIKKTIVLIAHHDTVGIEDYGMLPALDPDALKERFNDPTYLYGRGTGDMKSGIAVGMMLMEQLSEKNLHTGILFLSVPDEENGSAGIIAATSFLKKLQVKNSAEFMGCISLDSVLQDQHSKEITVVAGGIIGKYLPSFYIVGQSTHASEPYEGISSTTIASALVSLFHANASYSDKSRVTGELTPPPTCLKCVDIKDHYDVQLPLKTHMYFNYQTYHESPTHILNKVRSVSEKALSHALEENEKKYKNFMRKQRLQTRARPWVQKARVYTYAEVGKKAKKNNPQLDKDIRIILKKTKNDDIRERNFKVVEYVCQIASLPTPYIVCFFSPPCMPPSFDDKSQFIKTIQKTVKKFSVEQRIPLNIKAISEGMADLNYMQLEPSVAKTFMSYERNNPVSSFEPEFDMNILRSISMPIADIGPYALNMHQKEEKVAIEYTFTILPELLLSVISHLQ